MKIVRELVLVIFFFYSGILTAENFQLGEIVLADCHGFFAKGKIKRKQNDRYVIHFNKDARPIMCVPFAWDAAFIVKYKPITQHLGKVVTASGFIMDTTEEIMLKTNDFLQVKFKVLERDAMISDKYAVTVKLKEINGNGAAQLEVDSGSAKAKQAFERWVGTNYVTLNFSRSLKADRLTFLEVRKQ